MIQAIDRLRLIHNEKLKTVFILCSIPLDLPVDELLTWKQRLSDALAQCDERGWDALPLAAKTGPLVPRGGRGTLRRIGPGRTR